MNRLKFKPRKCGNGTAIHHYANGKSPCHHPDCKCKDYKPAMK